MNRRQLAFIILLNAVVSLLVASCVVWIVEQRRPDSEELAAIFTPQPQAVIDTSAVAISSGGDSSNSTNGGVAAQPGELAPSTPQLQPNSNAGGDTYIIQSGDSLTGIANKFGLTVNQLLNINNLDNPDFVFVGQRLILPAGRASQTAPQQPASNSQPSRTINGQMQIATVDGATRLDAETVVVVNESDAAFNLQGWTLGREGGPIFTFGNLPIFPGGSVRVHSSGGNNTSIDLYWNQPGPVWAAGNVVRLVNVGGELVHTFTVQ